MIDLTVTDKKYPEWVELEASPPNFYGAPDVPSQRVRLSARITNTMIRVRVSRHETVDYRIVPWESRFRPLSGAERCGNNRRVSLPVEGFSYERGCYLPARLDPSDPASPKVKGLLRDLALKVSRDKAQREFDRWTRQFARRRSAVVDSVKAQLLEAARHGWPADQLQACAEKYRNALDSEALTYASDEELATYANLKKQLED